MSDYVTQQMFMEKIGVIKEEEDRRHSKHDADIMDLRNEMREKFTRHENKHDELDRGFLKMAVEQQKLVGVLNNVDSNVANMLSTVTASTDGVKEAVKRIDQKIDTNEERIAANKNKLNWIAGLGSGVVFLLSYIEFFIKK